MRCSEALARSQGQRASAFVELRRDEPVAIDGSRGPGLPRLRDWVVRPHYVHLMELAAELAGYWAAHAFRFVFDGETLIPLLGWETRDGKRMMRRLVADSVEQGVREGQDQLARNSEGATQAVLVYGGFITLPTGKVDALLIDLRDYSSPLRSLLMAVPYEPASPQACRVHRPKFLSFRGREPDYQAVTSAFFQGWTLMRRLRMVGVKFDR